MRAAAIDRFGGPRVLSIHLADAARSHQRLARGHVLGKIVLRIR
jgi:hypothetical protein